MRPILLKEYNALPTFFVMELAESVENRAIKYKNIGWEKVIPKNSHIDIAHIIVEEKK